MKPWKSYRWSWGRWGGFSLQWGHGDEAVEEVLVDDAIAPVNKASMGPRR